MERFNVKLGRNFIWTLIGIVCGYMTCDMQSREKPLLAYVAQEEILELEKARLALIKEPDQKQMFFGNLTKATELIENEASSYEDKNTIVVLSSHRVYGDHVRSISKEVYERVIQDLVQRKNGEKND